MNLMALNPVVAATLIMRGQVAKKVAATERFQTQVATLAAQLLSLIHI